jgi:uncharacterized membrane protein (UPF0127 family)
MALAALAACAQPAEKPAPPPASASADIPPTAKVPPVHIPADAPPEPTPGHRELLEIATSQGVVPFRVEIADDDAERQQGLMFRRSMAPNDGMLFDFGEERKVFFWMKNTYIPLDMIFIRADGTIAAIAENAVPMDESPIGPGTEVRAVLELNAGRAEALGIRPGDRVSHRIFPAR